MGDKELQINGILKRGWGVGRGGGGEKKRNRKKK